MNKTKTKEKNDYNYYKKGGKTQWKIKHLKKLQRTMFQSEH